METKKISKWDAAPKSIKNMQEIVNALYDPLPDEQNPIIDALSKVLDDYNELEARHQKECGMISQYEEENRNLKDDIRTILQEIADLVEEKIELEERLVRQSECSKDRCNDLAYRNAKYAWAIKTVLKKVSYSPGHVAEELRIMAKKSTTPKDVIERWEGIADELLGEHSKLVDKINRLEKENEELKGKASPTAYLKWASEKCNLENKVSVLEESNRMLKKIKTNLETQCESKDDAHLALRKELNANGIGILGSYDSEQKAWEWTVDTGAHDYRLKEKLNGRFPWGNEKHKYKMFECPYLKDKYYNF